MEINNYIYAQFENEDQKEVSMLLYGAISERFGENMVNAHAFASEMLMLHDAGYKINVRINSEGGDVLRGLSILDAVVQTEADTIAVGMAASMGGVIHQAGKVRRMTDYGSIMIHAASGGDKQLKEIVDAQLKHLLTMKSNLGDERITKILSGDTDEWFAVMGVPDERNAEKMGLVDEVIHTGREMPLNISQFEQKPANLFSIYAKMIENKNNNSYKMENALLKAHLKVGKSADESEMIAGVDTLINKAVDDKQKEIDALKAENNTLKAGRAADLIEEAKELGYPENKIDSLEVLAQNSYETAQGAIEALKEVKKAATPVASVAAAISNNANAKEPIKAKKYEDYTEAEWVALSEEEQKEILNIK